MRIVADITFSDKKIEVVLDDGDSFTALYSARNSVLLYEGADISDDDIDRMKDEFLRTECISSALSYLRNPHTERDVSVYLKKKGFTAEQAAAAMEYCVKNGYVNDEDYAAGYIESVMKRRAAGEYYYFKKLFDKGIKQPLAKKIVAQFAPEINRIDSILLFAAKKWKAPVSREKFYRFLVSRGYSDAVARVALKAAAKAGMIVQGDDDVES